ncbi:MAG: hypothetical protein QM597_10515 [Aeromicrobium sp.]|uniref:AAA family ATPase n=1 Tax=Aeromicrobium sp. TaxID=1871063 RepID=UPI0039E2191B
MTPVAVAAVGASWEAVALAAVEASDHLTLARRCVDLAELLAVTRTGAARVAVVDTGLAGLDLDAVRDLTEAGVRVVSCGDAATAQALGIAVHCPPEDLGRIDFDQPEEEVPTETVQAVPERRGGRVVTVWGPAGAPGRSSLAVALASAAAAREPGMTVALVDADVAGGALAPMLGVLDEVSGVLAACRAAAQARAEEVPQHLLEIEPGLGLLTGLARPDQWPLLRAGAFEQAVERLRGQVDLVVVDVGSGLDLDGGGARSRHAVARQGLEQADLLVAVGRSDPLGLARLVRGLNEVRDLLAALPHALVVNRHRPTLGWSEREVAETIWRLAGVRPEAFLPDDPACLDAAMMVGITPRAAAPQSPFVLAVDALVTSLLTRSAVVASPSP